MIIFLYFLILLLILFLIIYDTTLIENYTNRQKIIILMGDSILDNENYVDKSVVNYIEEQISNSEDVVICLAKDNSTIQDSTQEQYPELNLQDNHSNTYIFVSIGGNDILQKIVYRDASQVVPTTLDSIISDYDNFIKKVKTKMSHSHIILLTLYYPHASYYRNFDSYIDKWNINVITIAKKYHCQVLDLSKFMKNSEDFSHSIEPSDIGGEKMVDHMMNMC